MFQQCKQQLKDILHDEYNFVAFAVTTDHQKSFYSKHNCTYNQTNENT